jgi:hypothetical protein
MINSQNLINKICDKINLGGLTSLQTCQTDNALTILNSPVKCVASFADLPSVTDYAGRMIYVGDENRYYAAVDGFWLNNFDSQINNYADVIYVFGSNVQGRLGINSSLASSRSPVSVAGGFTDWCQVSAGSCHNLGLRGNGTAWAWGNNINGRLGDNNGTVASRSSPVSVVGGFTDWCQVSAGNQHSLAVRSNGTTWAWGVGTLGRLGDNTTISRSSPVSVVGGFTDWCQVSAGGAHSLGVRCNGTAWAWGSNSNGLLGDNDGAVANRSSPVSVAGGFTDWCQVSGGEYHSLGLRTNGTAWAWGRNACGQLGDDTTISRSSPVSVCGGFTDWCQISAGRYHSLAVRSNGTAWSWGDNRQGRLGDNSTISRSSPVSVVGGFTDWCQVSAGCANSLGVRTNGTAWGWGINNYGVLGDGTTGQRSSPVSVVSRFTGWCQVSAGHCHSTGLAQKCTGF